MVVALAVVLSECSLQSLFGASTKALWSRDRDEALMVAVATLLFEIASHTIPS